MLDLPSMLFAGAELSVRPNGLGDDTGRCESIEK
jgi:hypothetical protein